MKNKSASMAMAVALLIAAGCGGGGGGSSGGDGGGSSVETPSSPTSAVPDANGVVAFSGRRGDYTVTRIASGYTVTGPSITNVPGSATAMRFSDMTINLGIGAKAQALGSAQLRTLIELYTALLNRVPDADSLSVLIDALIRDGQTMVQLADRLHAEAVLAPDLTGYFPAMTTGEFVTAVYKNVFQLSGVSAPLPAEVAAWSSRIVTERGALVLTMLEEARAGSVTDPNLSAPAIIQLLNNKIEVGHYFAVQQGLNFIDDSATRRTAMAVAVTSAVDSVATAKGMVGFADPTFNLASP